MTSMPGQILSICADMYSRKGDVSMRRVLEIPPPVTQENADEFALLIDANEGDEWIAKHPSKDTQDVTQQGMLNCPFCHKRLLIPDGYQGNLTCGQCNKSFTTDSVNATIEDYHAYVNNISGSNSKVVRLAGIILISSLYLFIAFDVDQTIFIACAIVAFIFLPEIIIFFTAAKYWNKADHLTAEEALEGAFLNIYLVFLLLGALMILFWTGFDYFFR